MGCNPAALRLRDTAKDVYQEILGNFLKASSGASVHKCFLK